MCSLSMQSIFPMCHLSSEPFSFTSMPYCLSHFKWELKFLDGTKIQLSRKFILIHILLSLPPSSFSPHLMSLLCLLPLLPCALYPLHPPLSIFFFFLALAETWSLGSHTSVSPPSSLQNLPLWLLLPSKSRLADYGESRRGRQKDI